MADDPLTVTYQKQTTGAYNPSTGEVATTVVDILARGILLDLTLSGNGLTSKYGTNILTGDKELYMQPVEKTDALVLSLIPDPTQDFVVVAGITYKVMNMKEINPSGTNPIAYFLHIRR